MTGVSDRDWSKSFPQIVYEEGPFLCDEILERIEDADLNQADVHGKTLLMYACEFFNDELALALLKRGVDTNVVCPENGYVAFHFLFTSKYLDRDRDLHFQNDLSSLHEKREEPVQFLDESAKLLPIAEAIVRHGGILTPDKLGASPLVYAADRGLVKSVEYLTSLEAICPRADGIFAMELLGARVILDMCLLPDLEESDGYEKGFEILQTAMALRCVDCSNSYEERQVERSREKNATVPLRDEYEQNLIYENSQGLFEEEDGVIHVRKVETLLDGDDKSQAVNRSRMSPKGCKIASTSEETGDGRQQDKTKVVDDPKGSEKMRSGYLKAKNKEDLARIKGNRRALRAEALLLKARSYKMGLVIDKCDITVVMSHSEVSVNYDEVLDIADFYIKYLTSANLADAVEIGSSLVKRVLIWPQSVIQSDTKPMLSRKDLSEFLEVLLTAVACQVGSKSTKELQNLLDDMMDTVLIVAYFYRDKGQLDRLCCYVERLLNICYQRVRLTTPPPRASFHEPGTQADKKDENVSKSNETKCSKSQQRLAALDQDHRDERTEPIDRNDQVNVSDQRSGVHDNTAADGAEGHHSSLPTNITCDVASLMISDTNFDIDSHTTSVVTSGDVDRPVSVVNQNYVESEPPQLSIVEGLVVAGTMAQSVTDWFASRPRFLCDTMLDVLGRFIQTECKVHIKNRVRNRSFRFYRIFQIRKMHFCDKSAISRAMSLLVHYNYFLQVGHRFHFHLAEEEIIRLSKLYGQLCDLQELSARVVRRFNLPYQITLPKTLHKLIELK